MDAMAWLWAGALSVVAFVMGAKVGFAFAVRCFVSLLLRFGLWDAYLAASARHNWRNS